MKRKIFNILLLSIGITNSMSASSGSEQAKMLVMAVASIVILVVVNLRKKK
jgi:hypothetical protein